MSAADLPCSDPVLIAIPADPDAVRAVLRALFGTRPLCALSDDIRGTAELVLAEALNNIVEHAYAGQQGEISIRLSLCSGDLVCRIEDSGLPMPQGAPPVTDLTLHGDDGDLREGGFGWHLIRTLSRDLEYRRCGGRNLLSFRLDAGQ